MRVQINTPTYLSFTEEQANKILTSNGYSPLWVVDKYEDCGLTSYSREYIITKDSFGTEHDVENVLSDLFANAMLKVMSGGMKMLSESKE